MAENLTDDVLLIDAATGKIEHRFDLAESDAVPSTYPIALQLSKDGRRAFVALWNASEIVELNLDKERGRTQAGAAEAGESCEAGNASVRVCAGGGWQDALCGAGQSRCRGGGECGRGAIRGEGLLRYATAGAELLWRGAGGGGAECVGKSAVCGEHGQRCGCGDRHAEADRRRQRTTGMVEPDGFVPTEWMPMSMAFLPGESGGRLFVATAKGRERRSKSVCAC